MDAQDCRTFVTPQGLRILCLTIPSDLVHIEWRIQTGFDMELDPRETQTRHLMEHLLCNFTSTKYMHGLTNIEEMARRAIKNNGLTSTKTCLVWMSGLAQDASFMLDLMLSTLFAFQIDDHVFEQERQAVIEELTAQLNDPWTALYEFQQQTLYPDLPRARTIDQCLRNVNRLNQQDMLDIFHQYYRPDQSILSICGPAQLVSLVQTILYVQPLSMSCAPNHYGHYIGTSWVQSTNESAVYSVSVPNVQQTRILVSFRLQTVDAFNVQDELTIDALVYILTQSIASRLYVALRYILGDVYYCHAAPYLDPVDSHLSRLDIETSTKPERMMQVFSTLMNCLKTMQQIGLSEQEWQHNVQNYFMIQFTQLQDNTSPARYIDSYANSFAWTNCISTNRSKLQQLHKMKRQQVNRHIAEWLQDPIVFIAS